MGLYAGSANFHDEVYQFDETDVVMGGPDGIDNLPLKHLADRTIWLKGQLGQIHRLTGVKEYNSAVSGVNNFSVVPADVEKKLINITSDRNLAINLGNITGYTDGALLIFSSSCVAGKAISIVPQAGQFINLYGENKEAMYMCHKEQLIIMRNGTKWEYVTSEGNFFDAGDEYMSRKQKHNTLIKMGQLVNRADYPRLTEYVLSLSIGQEVTTDSTWLSSNLYRGLFSTGDGVSTIRLPDDRGMFERGLDLGRGIDIDRTHPYPGGFEDDALKSHSHRPMNGSGGSATGPIGPTTGFSGQDNNSNFISANNLIENTGGTETRPKNNGKLPLIKY